jgi:hypothetical protein
VKDIPQSMGIEVVDDTHNATSPASGVKVTIIDLGLARMDGYDGEQRWTEFDPEIFEGEGRDMDTPAANARS